MKNYFVIDRIDGERWNQAQEWEKKEWKQLAHDGEDWNKWWAEKFDNYKFLEPYKINIKSILEVGCGPWAKNTKHVQQIIGKNQLLYLEDPLLDDYIKQGKSIKNINAIKLSVPLEEMILENKVDLVICINVMDHVYSVSKCFESIKKCLNPGGIFVFGNDLTNEDDYKTMPIPDIGHPIRLDLESYEEFLKPFQNIYYKVLDRKSGRNPTNHYATLLYAGLNNV